MMSLDFNKPIRTRDGRKVRIICTDATDLENGETIVALVEDADVPMTYQGDGKWLAAGGTSEHDLVNYDPGYTRVMSLFNTLRGELVALQADVLEPDGYKKVGDFRVTIKEGVLYHMEVL